MKPTSVTVAYKRTLNTGDYSSVALSASATIELEEGDTAEAALTAGMDICRAAVKDAAAPFVKAGVPVTVSETFQGKPVNTLPAGLSNGEAAGIGSELTHDHGAR